MEWTLTDDVEAFADRTRALLAADPVTHSIPLGVIELLREGVRWSSQPPLLGWAGDPPADPASAAVCMVPPYELTLVELPRDAVRGLVSAVRARGDAIPAVRGRPDQVEAFVEGWTATGAARGRPGRQERLYALTDVAHAGATGSRATASGRARPATPTDSALLSDWHEAFARESGQLPVDRRAWLDTAVDTGLAWVWEADTRDVVAMALHAPARLGVSSIGPVYTPPGQRRRGYGTAVTTACAAAAFARGAHTAVLRADLSDPTPNSIYQRIGFRPVHDLLTVHL